MCLLLEHIPGGAKWRYVWGSCLAFVFACKLITGVLLMTAYSPGDSTAWGSVYFIQYEMEFGWLIRGLHHFGSQTMVVLLGLHMLQVVIAGAQLPPREINWWLGLALMGGVLGLSLTGYLLPWDQKGYWATQVATNIAGNLPGIGDFHQTIVVGGPEYGNHTLTRFYALHVGILPPVDRRADGAAHRHLSPPRRHRAQGRRGRRRVLARPGVQGSGGLPGGLWRHAWPGHLRRPGPRRNTPATGRGRAKRSLVRARWAYAGKDGRGANLDAPADPQEQYPARPEWYFLFLFQLLKYFEGDQILIGTVVIPNGVAVVLFLLPLFGYGRMRPLGHVLGVLVVVAVLTAAASLTCLAIADDTPDPVARKLLEDLAFFHIPILAGVLLMQLAFVALTASGRSARWSSPAAALVLAIACGWHRRGALRGSDR